ncbi:MAG: penicillin-binding protein activator LpoB [Thermoguttaceae bacterium]|jgi:hypothetical protein
MNTRNFVGRGLLLPVLGICMLAGCRTHQTAQVVKPGDKEMVGSHTAGAETYGPLVDGAVGNLLGRYSLGIQPASLPNTPSLPPRRICFIGVENKSSEEIGDFKEQLYELIDSRIVHSQMFQAVSRRYVDAGLEQSRLRRDELFVPQNQRIFAAAMEQMGQPFDYLLYATVTSGTTRDNKDYQKNYLLTLEMVSLRDGHYEKESAEIVKQYNVSAAAKVRGMFK